VDQAYYELRRQSRGALAVHPWEGEYTRKAFANTHGGTITTALESLRENTGIPDCDFTFYSIIVR
jgi:hypothetical protein